MKVLPSIENILFLVVLILIEFNAIYLFKRIKVTDIPSYRSSHAIPTPRGGGIIFPIAFIYWFLKTNQQDWILLSGLIALAIISFWDDIKSLSPGVRIVVHLLAAIALLYSTVFYLWSWGFIVIAFIILLAFMNAYNFMDGINGITGLYSLAALATFLFINSTMVQFTDSNLLLFLIMSVVVFLLFNFRRRAKIFSGDVGSFSMSFLLAYFSILLIAQTGEIKYIFLFMMYGIDAFFTIVQRLLEKENITLPHRKHLYQLLANEYKLPHLLISCLFVVIQLGLNCILLFNYFTFLSLMGLLVMMSIFYIISKWLLINRLRTS